jgi:uncharacterized protein (DUF433 family)
MEVPVLHITIDDKGIPRTINRRVKVKMIVQRHIFADEPLQDIADYYGINLADAYAAMAYYYDNKATIDAQFEESERLLREHGVSGAELRAKIEARMQQKNEE